MKAEKNILLKGRNEIDPLSIQAYISEGGFRALKAARGMKAEDIIGKITTSGLRGRGGAEYPVGKKWSLVWQESREKYIVCNADEGEAGTFKDRELLTYIPMRVIEGILIAACTLNAKKGCIYLRGEYLSIYEMLKDVIAIVKKDGYFPEGFELEVISGAGAYICGEETALLSSIENGIGEPKMKPPYPTGSGLYGFPTLINNVETFACIPGIINGEGADTKLISLSGMVRKRGVFEIEIDRYSIYDMIYSEQFGKGMKNGKAVKFIQLGGQSGSIIFPEQMHIPYGYEWMEKAGLGIGAGAVTVYNEEVSLVDYCRNIVEFFVDESCGKCSPCRIGLSYIAYLLRRLCSGSAATGDVERLAEAARQISQLAFCGLGRSAVKVLSSVLEHRREEFLIYEKGICNVDVGFD